jgi:splicing factor 1
LRKKENNLRSKVNIIEELMKMRKTFVPPNDYRPLKKFRKIYLTDVLYTPDINYIGLIIGPKGNIMVL